VSDSFVGITFFNSSVDRDLFKVFHIRTYVFYSDKPPKNFFGPVFLEHTLKYDELQRYNVMVQSRLVKFFPWRYISGYDFFVYSDYRIDVHKRFFKVLNIDRFPLFLKHREGGVYLHELVRNFDRGRISSDCFSHISKLIKGHFDLPIMENGLLCLKKSNYMPIEDFIINFELILRDQLVVPVLIHETINYLEQDLNNLRYFHVNSKQLNFLNLIKRYIGIFYTRI
jgi:hypothetical protein